MPSPARATRRARDGSSGLPGVLFRSCAPVQAAAGTQWRAVDQPHGVAEIHAVVVLGESGKVARTGTTGRGATRGRGPRTRSRPRFTAFSQDSPLAGNRLATCQIDPMSRFDLRRGTVS